MIIHQNFFLTKLIKDIKDWEEVAVVELGSATDGDVYKDRDFLLNFRPPFYLNDSYVYMKILPRPQRTTLTVFPLKCFLVSDLCFC